MCNNETLSVCSAGYYSLKGSSECVLCSPGEACPLPFITPISCDAGQHTNGNGGATVCSDCPPGHFCPHPR